MIYRYSSIQCTDFYQLPTASNLQDKKHSWIGHLLVPIPLACSRLWDSRVRRIKKVRTQKKSRGNWSEKGGTFFPAHPPFYVPFTFVSSPLFHASPLSESLEQARTPPVSKWGKVQNLFHENEFIGMWIKKYTLESWFFNTWFIKTPSQAQAQA